MKPTESGVNMKRFHELTKPQQELAIEWTIRELKDCIRMGIVDFGKTLSENRIRDFAVGAAEEAYYPEEYDKVVDEIARTQV